MPSVEEYTAGGENAVAEATAYDSVDASTSYREGTIACTENRVVFSRDKYVADISLRSVNSIEYEEPSYPLEYLYWAILGMISAAVISTVGPEFIAEQELIILLSGLLTFGGLGTIAVGYLYMRHQLRIHTPSKSYEFSSSSGSLSHIAHAVREHEP